MDKWSYIYIRQNRMSAVLVLESVFSVFAENEVHRKFPCLYVLFSLSVLLVDQCWTLGIVDPALKKSTRKFFQKVMYYYYPCLVSLCGTVRFTFAFRFCVLFRGWAMVQENWFVLEALHLRARCDEWTLEPCRGGQLGLYSWQMRITQR